MPDEIKYLVAKETYKYVFCTTCKGSGTVTSYFQTRQFKKTCNNCGGTGKQRITHRTEISLQTALENLKNQQNGL